MYFLKKVASKFSNIYRIPVATYRPPHPEIKAMKVTVCGAGSQVGQPLSLLLKQSPLVEDLALFDRETTEGLSMELSLIDTNCKVKSYNMTTVCEAFKDADVVAIINGSEVDNSDVTEKSFNRHGAMIKKMMAHVSKYCPEALVAIATAPVEGMVPLACDTLKFLGSFDPSKVFGLTTRNVVRANTIAANILGLEPECLMVPVIGGNSKGTIIPVLSQALPCSDYTEKEIEKITKSLQEADLVSERNKCSDGFALSMAFSMARFVLLLLKGLKGIPDILTYTYIRTNDVEQVKYFGVPVFLGPGGVQKDLGLPSMNPYESCLVQEAIPIISQWITKAHNFTGLPDPKLCDPCASKLNAPCPDDQCSIRRKWPLSH